MKTMETSEIVHGRNNGNRNTRQSNEIKGTQPASDLVDTQVSILEFFLVFLLEHSKHVLISVLRGPDPVDRKCSRDNHCQRQRSDDPLPTSPTVSRWTSQPLCILVDYTLMYICVCVYYTHLYTFIYSYAFMHLCIVVLYAFTYMHLRTWILVRVCTYVFICVCMCLRTYILTMHFYISDNY